MNRVRLIFGSTNSLPVGTPDDEIEQVYQRSYKPFLRTLYNSPQVPGTLHYSGHMLQWLERYHSEYTDVLSEMIARKQVELLGGGFYDPVLSLIPRPDRLGQIESLTTYLRKRFGRRPRGSWITEHVWEPSLASTLRSSGMEYAFLDDYHFIAAGLEGRDLQRPCIAEDQGKTIAVFPVCRDLRSISRTGTPEELISYMRSHASDDPGQVFVLLDSGERFAHAEYDAAPADAPPGADSWLDRLVELLHENRSWIDVELPSGYLKEIRPRTRGYFSVQTACDSLRSRSEVTIDGHVFRGHFRQFLVKYAESNLMYAKMQYTHVLVNQIRGDKYRKQAAREDLWKGQCHSAYWHGSHCGIYRNRLRKQVYHSLIEAEKKARERGIFKPSVVTIDFDMDGLDEFLYQGLDLNAYVHAEGGILFELDYLPKSWNYLDTLGRRPERYHTEEIEALGYDRYPRKSFVDHFLSESATVSDFDRAAAEEQGSFIAGIYDREDAKRDAQHIGLSATGTVKQENAQCEVMISKRYRFRRSAVEVDYKITCLSEAELHTVFAPELNFAFLSQEASDLRVLRHSGETSTEIGPERQCVEAANRIRFDDLVNAMSLSVVVSRECGFWIVPVHTVCHCAGHPETEYQGSSVVPRIAVDLDPGASTAVSISIQFERM